MAAKCWTEKQLLEASGLDCDVSSLHRKLQGSQGITADQVRLLAAALGVSIPGIRRAIAVEQQLGIRATWPGKRGAKAS